LVLFDELHVLGDPETLLRVGATFTQQLPKQFPKGEIQALRQLPQLFGSLENLPAQTPAEQHLLAQTFPQLPQLSAFSAKSTQAPLQQLNPS
jgi:hypothetical protein